ncbi:basic helix-loop-helix domain-containing protein USF3 [Corythoichthys intestinalis]|uniref:basic helix-loop-helix domain-containing protein USF3 n=1 Tax=Corythoichthys intestinalis TaxID=161448 RepID=UPI0025A5CBFB|nr:basic helix-loop-helix domain-containing protein USF3 [Corythoichthys intestinalis]XP_061809924.1 basic helix-loop-helix domain-containing protein USF3-like [Nerophis lumbriciformis]
MPEMTETETGRKPKKKKNKESHNAVERHRKEKINAGINRIGNLLPCSQALKQSKNMILDQAFRYITELKKQNDAMLLEGGDKVQADEIRRLRRQCEELRKESGHYIELLKAHDINILEDPTIHWKGKKRCTKVAKVTPTHQLPKRIIVYSNGNVMCPTGKDANPGKQLSETLILQPPSDVNPSVRVNGALLQPTSSATLLHTGSGVTHSTAGLTVVEQCVIEKPPEPPSMSYITLQLPTVNTGLAQPPAVPSLTNIAATSASQLPPPVSCLATINQTVRDTTLRTVNYTAIPNSQALLRAGAAGSTQTTWTTLQMAGNTVQPVCQSLGSTTQAVHQVTVCPVGTKPPPVQPIQIQMQPPPVPVQQAPITAHIQARPPQLRPAIPVLAPQPQCAVVPPPAIVAHPTIVSQPQPAVLQPASLIPHTPTALIPQAQQQATVLPLLQTMQVLQVNPSSATASVPQNTNNPSVVILQQANSCPSQPVIREEVSNPTPCQHIVIIQAPNQTAPASQNPKVGLVPTVAATAVPASIPATQTTNSSTSTLQSVGGKQLVHILPRPAQPPLNHPSPMSQAATGVQATPQTITVNGQVFALQPMKTSDKTASQSTIQLVQPTTIEEPTTNVALNSLGALSSLNQSISQGLPLSISSQSNNSNNNCDPPQAAPSADVQQKRQPPAPVSVPGATVVTPVQQLQVPRLSPVKSGLAVSVPKLAGKRLRTNLQAKRSAAKRTKVSKKSELNQASSENQKTSQASDIPLVAPTTVSGETVQIVPSPQSSPKTVICVTSSGPSGFSQPQPQTVASVSANPNTVIFSQPNSSVTATTVATVSVASLTPSVSEALATNDKAAVASNGSSVVNKPVELEMKQLATSEATDTTQSNTAIPITVSKTSRTVVTATGDSNVVNKSITPAIVCTTAVVAVTPSTQSESCPKRPDNTDSVPCSKYDPSPSSTTATSLSLVSTSTTNSELRKTDTAARVQTEQPDPNVPTDAKLPQPVGKNRQTEEERPATSSAVSTTHTMPKKDLVLSHGMYTNLDDQPVEPPVTDSSMSIVAGGGRGFSVASMLPQGQGMTASSGSFGSFTFTSEQAEMLALAMLEQDSPGRRAGNCVGNDTAPATWQPPKVLASKEKNPTGQQAKLTKPVDSVTVKPPLQVSVRGQIGDSSVSGAGGSRHPQNPAHLITYTQSQVQTQSSAQSGTVASLSVNNLIRPSSSQRPYPGSPSLLGQQCSVPSPATASVHIAQPSNNTLSPCSGAAQLNEYTPMKTLMRAQAERQVKILSKRQAQEEAMLNTGKRPKPCPPPGPAVGHMDVKIADHNQMMVGQMPTSSSTMARINSEGSLFSTNSFMSTVVQATDTHCPPEQNQPGVPHLSQGHPQHSVAQPVQHLGGNVYMKQHQQEQQRHHLYHLQHHLSQPDPAQRHSLHQRALQQEQHAQKKRGLVRGSQTASPAAVAMQQKQHHLEKSGVQQQHSHPQQAPHQQHTQQQQQATQQHSQQSHQQSHQPAQHQQSHPQQHQGPTHQSQQHQQQHHQQLQQQQNSHSRHQQHLQQQIQQQQHFRHQEKSCEAQAAGARAHHNNHLAQQDHLKPGPDHSAMQRMMTSRSLDPQQLISSPGNPASRSSDLSCAPSRQERHRVSNYSAEALIGKSSTSADQQQRMAHHLQTGRGGAAPDRGDPRGYVDASGRGKANVAHNPQGRLPSDHPGSADVQRVSECPPFKTAVAGPHQLGGFEAQASRGSDMAPKSQRAQQQQGSFRMGVGPPPDGRNRGGGGGGYPGVQLGPQGAHVGPSLLREQEACHQSFMQSLLTPDGNHQRATQCCPPVSMEYTCGSSSGDVRAKASSPGQKPPSINKSHISQVNNMHGVVRATHPPEPNRPSAPVSQHSRHAPPSKLRPGERPRSGPLRPSNPFEPDNPPPLPSGGGVLLGRPQSGGEARRSTIVRFMADGAQPPADNNPAPEQHLTQNFGFPFIPEGSVNAPINTNATFMPPSSQPNTARTPSLLPVEPQNTLPSFYPSYSPAAHPGLAGDVTLQYFSNQMFPGPGADKSGAPPPLNNRFGSILSPPRPVGFAQASFPLLPDMPPMPIANSSGITPHISNFSLTSLFPEIAAPGMPADGSAMPMSPLLSLANASAADSGKQPNRPAHNISHILGHDGSSAV